jgi:hypothetical protein
LLHGDTEYGETLYLIWDMRQLISLDMRRNKRQAAARHSRFDVGHQIEQLAAAGWLTDLPDPSARPRPAVDWEAFVAGGLDRPYAEIETAARDYLDVNCGHCHNPRGVNGITSQLFLNWDNTDQFRLGKCKRPGSASHGTGGLTYDIVPGDHSRSILWYRMHTDDPGAMMPQLGRALVDREAVALIAAWIDGMEPEDCD